MTESIARETRPPGLRPERAGGRVAPAVGQLRDLRKIVCSYHRVLVAFSGGADSAFVLKICRDVLGPENVKAVIARSPSLPQSELEAARRVAGEIGAELLVIETRELENPEYAANSTRRCYFCKSELYSHLLPLAEKLGMQFVVNGINRDDLGDWRPGLRAAGEYGIKSPLVEAGFGKEKIRFHSRELGLSTWSKPQAACLSSRIPFGTEVTGERLRQIEAAEEVLKQLGFNVVRVRWIDEDTFFSHRRGGLNLPYGEASAAKALIELGADEVSRFFCHQEIRKTVLSRFRKLGFRSAALELAGYRPGRFNPAGLSRDGSALLRRHLPVACDHGQILLRIPGQSPGHPPL